MEISNLNLRLITADERKRIDNNFTYHPPQGSQPEKYEHIRKTGKLVAEEFCGLCPESRELSLAITKLEEAIFWANAAIARNSDGST
jgi:hypothetical protein